jgi:hypothetical protein
MDSIHQIGAECQQGGLCDTDPAAKQTVFQATGITPRPACTGPLAATLIRSPSC